MEGTHTYKPVRFFLFANLITWTTWLTAAWFSYHQSGGSSGIASILEIIGLFGPCAAAMWIIFGSKNSELKENFYERLVNLRLMKLWTVPVILIIMPVTAALSVLISHLFFGQPLEQLMIDTTPFAAGVIPIPLLLFGAALVEELGWKGYGVDSLRGERSFFQVTLIFAALWAFWHIPTFFVNDYYQNTLIRTNPLFAVNFVVSIFPAAVIGNWLWYTNRGSILTAVLFHAAVNFQGMLHMGQVAKCIETVVWLVLAAIVVAFNKNKFFERFPPQIGHYG